jgi:hypothetical protein
MIHPIIANINTLYTRKIWHFFTFFILSILQENEILVSSYICICYTDIFGFLEFLPHVIVFQNAEQRKTCGWRIYVIRCLKFWIFGSMILCSDFYHVRGRPVIFTQWKCMDFEIRNVYWNKIEIIFLESQISYLTLKFFITKYNSKAQALYPLPLRELWDNKCSSLGH